MQALGLSLERLFVVGADAVMTAEGYTDAPQRLGAGGPTGVEGHGMYAEGPPGTWESLSSPRSGPDGATGEEITPGLSGERGRPVGVA